MKKIIKGRTYNTETAYKVAYAKLNSPLEQKIYEHTLYRKRTGEYFLHARGGHATRYQTGMFHGLAQKIVPFTIDDAKHFLEEEGLTQIYIEEFGEPEE